MGGPDFPLSPPVHGHGSTDEDPEDHLEEGLVIEGWTGVLVKGDQEQLPMYITLAQDWVPKPGSPDGGLDVFIGPDDNRPGVRCRCVVQGKLVAVVVPVQKLDVGEQRISFYPRGLSPEDDGADAKPLSIFFSPYEQMQLRKLPCTVVDKVKVTYPEPDAEDDRAVALRGNSLAAIALAEDHHESYQVIEKAHEVAVLITKSHPSDYASVFVFGLKAGKARLDRYETAETSLEQRQKWDFIDTCALGEVVVSAQGDLTQVKLADGVDFVFEPRSTKQAYSVSLHVGSHQFAAITPVGYAWISWFSKEWVPRVALGDPEEADIIERYAAPTIASLTKRQRHEVNRAASPGRSPAQHEASRPAWKCGPAPVVSPDGKHRTSSPARSAGVRNRPAESGRNRATILHNEAPEMAMYERGTMVGSNAPKRVPALNMSPDVAKALKPGSASGWNRA